MEGLTHLVSESLARHGVGTELDHRRLQWSKWFRCESSFSVLLAPSKPGLYALGEEVIAPGQLSATGAKRLLALFSIRETDDLGMALGRLFLPGSPEQERLANGECYVRYAVMEDDGQRQAAYAALQRWMASSSEAASGLSREGQSFPGIGDSRAVEASDGDPPGKMQPPAPLPSGF